MARRSLPLAGEIPVYKGDLLGDVLRIKNLKTADAITGGLSRPSKMPEWAYSIPATRCRIGSVLADKEGTVCSSCYARKGRFVMPKIQTAMERRYQALSHPLWVPAMVLSIRRRLVEFFRWHSSGDLQSVQHLQNIVTVAGNTPTTKHWLPTREAGIVRQVPHIPENLVVRVSAHLIDGEPPADFYSTSRVVSDPAQARPDERLCPAPENGGSCGSCRLCWDGDVKAVVYKLH